MTTNARRTRNEWGKISEKWRLKDKKRVAGTRKFYAEYTGPDGKRHTAGRSFKTRTDAQGWLAAEKKLIDVGKWNAPATRDAVGAMATLTVREWLEEYLHRLNTGTRPLRPSTLQQYRRVLKTRILSPEAPGNDDKMIVRLADVPLADLSKRDVMLWWDGLQKAYPSMATTNQKAYQRLRQAIANAVEREIIPANPVYLKEATISPVRKEKYLPSDEEIALILNTVPGQYKALTSLVLHHGLRLGEAIALERRHLTVVERGVGELPRVFVTVEQNAQRIGTETGTIMLMQPPKSHAGYRDVPIMDTDVPIFLDHLEHHAPLSKTVVQTMNGERDVQLLTATSTGRIVMDTSYRSVLRRAEIKAGVSTQIDPHCGRNWLITRLAEQGAHLKEIGRLLGQDDVETILKVYMKVRAGRTESLMDKVNSSLSIAA